MMRSALLHWFRHSAHRQFLACRRLTCAASTLSSDADLPFHASVGKTCMSSGYEMPVKQPLPGSHAPPPRCGVRRRAQAALRTWLLSTLLVAMRVDQQASIQVSWLLAAS
jgi:hypothetical protein